MGCGEFIAVKLSVSDKYAIDSPVGSNDEGTTNKNRERKRKYAVHWAHFHTAGRWCEGRARKGEGWDVLVSAQMNAALGELSVEESEMSHGLLPFLKVGDSSAVVKWPQLLHRIIEP